MLKNLKAKAKSKDNRIAVLRLEGIILDSQSLPIASKFMEQLEEVKKKKYKALVIKLNTPGGTVGASQEIFDQINRLKKEGIKVVMSMGDVAASGGVYVAMAGDKVVSNPGTITGSIGVIIKTNVTKNLYKKIGVDQQVIKSGQHKDMLSSMRYLSMQEKKLLQGLIDNTYEQFVKVVANSRKLEVTRVKEFADGRIFSGEQAKDFGLIDEIGSFADAVDIAAKLAGIEKEPVLVDICPRKKSLIQKLITASVSEFFENAGISSMYSGIPLWLMKN